MRKCYTLFVTHREKPGLLVEKSKFLFLTFLDRENYEKANTSNRSLIEAEFAEIEWLEAARHLKPFFEKNKSFS